MTYTAVPLPTNPCISLPQHLPQVYPGLPSYTPRSLRVGATCHSSLKPEHLTHHKDSSEVMLVGVGLRCFTLPTVVSLSGRHEAGSGIPNCLPSPVFCLPLRRGGDGSTSRGMRHFVFLPKSICLSHTTVSSWVVKTHI